MDREQFVAEEKETWWLLDRDVEYRIEDLRRSLGASFGWTDPTWFSERMKLEEVHDFIVAQRRELFYELEQATDGEQRARWLESVIELKSPAVPLPAAPPPTRGSASAASAVPAARQTSSSPPRRSAFGSPAQADTANAPGAAQPAASTASVPPRRSAFGSRVQADTTSGADAAQPAPSTASAPPRRSPFASRAQKSAADGASNSSAAAATAGKSPANEHTKKPIDEQIQTVMSALSIDELTGMARELGLSPGEARAMTLEPDFASMVAEENARLEDRVNA